ncbi:MAG TPA: alpha/beta hydrolase [Gammaproteobacteria bacterium]|nr:alpha/beta hydrolase [Gammaproteobacteria bacterium]
MLTSSSTRHVNGVDLHVVEAGPKHGPLVILLHGFPDFWWGWRRQIEPLIEQGFFVVLPDQRGYNLSDKPLGVDAYNVDALAADVVGLADIYGRFVFRLVGHDWGGIVAWWTAVRFPARVERLIILNAPHPDVWNLLGRHRLRQALRSAYVGFFQFPRLPEALLKARNFALLRLSLTRTSRPSTFTPEDIARYVQAWAQPGALTAMLNYYRALRHKPKGPPRRVRSATLVIWGTRDIFLEQAVAQASLDLCDRGESFFLDTATHWVHLEEAKAVNTAAIRFFKAD